MRNLTDGAGEKMATEIPGHHHHDSKSASVTSYKTEKSNTRKKKV
jgi:hypothetical protein